MSRNHVAGVAALQQVCFPPPFDPALLWNADQLDHHIKLFSAGQLVACEGELVIGSATSLIISELSWRAQANWEETVGGHNLTAHVPTGTTLYGADISVHPQFRGRGVGRALYEARFELVRRLELDRFGTACRIPDFHSNVAIEPALTAELYCDEVMSGLRVDRTLTPLLRFGLTLKGVIHDFMEDPESHGAAALLEWQP